MAIPTIEIEHASAMPDALRTLDEIRLHQGKLKESEVLIRQLIALAQDNQDRVLEGYAWRALCSVQLQANQSEMAKASFANAVRLFTEAGVVEDMNNAILLGTNRQIESVIDPLT